MLNLIKNLSVVFIISFIFIILSNQSASAQGVNPNPFPGNGGVNTINLGQNLPKTGLGVPAPATGGIIGIILKNVISLFFIVGGLATLIYFVWGAVDWILSGGDKEKVAGARKKMTNATIGLVLLALSYFIVGLVGDIVGFNPLGPFDIKSLGEQ